ncbi:MAG: 1-(5-phosphoribosyl)-5-[(5-phosphoribosylamino)methylideneamino]imidazole-4-carboxamide isomerase [Elusimicrobia bacterium CG06_land_8_20_14_3_00_38_11]|nr:MAG: 1-(5-phosphoribosyl)-5-[(5-phosphoribosylamino)methylideneamino]imidazole-4-carboxamide isomerase [Elusimicrobia bacterium CG06_land_8_20_14_3_00_38_11]
MLIIPAIDIRGGNCVMLTQGKFEAETIYSKDPVFIAKMFETQGAKRIHIIDLDGAFAGTPQNLSILKKIKETVSSELEFGGGIRKIETIEKIADMGIDKIILGTVAVFNSDIVKEAVKKYKDKIIIAIDVYDDKIAIGGWKEITQYDALEFAKNMADMGIKEIITTDIKKDGMMEGPNIEGIKKLCKSGLSVIASGGVSTIENVKKISELEKFGVSGMIIGKALYNDSIKLDEAIKICSQKE